MLELAISFAIKILKQRFVQSLRGVRKEGRLSYRTDCVDQRADPPFNLLVSRRNSHRLKSADDHIYNAETIATTSTLILRSCT